MNSLQRRDWARGRVEFWWDRLCDYFRNNHLSIQGPPQVQFSKRMTRTAGRAWSAQHRIKLSMVMLMGEGDAFDQTIAHEVAHVFADQHHGKRCKHGHEWKRVMLAMGLRPDRCHNYETAAKITLKKGGEQVTCAGCCTKITVGPVQIKRVRQKGWDYQCVKCSTSLRKSMGLAPQHKQQPEKIVNIFDFIKRGGV